MCGDTRISDYPLELMLMNDRIMNLDDDVSREAVPVTILNPGLINGEPYHGSIRALLDSGASLTCIHRRCLPQGMKPYEDNDCNIQGFGGNKTINEMVELHQVVLPEFSKSFQLERIKAYVVEINSKHDIIVGRDVLRPAGFKMDFDKNVVEWMDMTISMKENSSSEVHLIDYASDVENPDG